MELTVATHDIIIRYWNLMLERASRWKHFAEKRSARDGFSAGEIAQRTEIENVPMFRFLLKHFTHGIDVDIVAKSHEPKEALLMRSRRGHLIRKSYVPQFSALTLAAKMGCPELVKVLIEAGAQYFFTVKINTWQCYFNIRVN